jgi:uncharacterized protein (DUF952 family)
MIYHLAEPGPWEAALLTGEYRAPTFEREKFIHLSTSEQVVATYGRYYTGRQDLVLLCVDEGHATIQDRLLWEASTGGQLFPHLYCPLPLVAVVDVERGWIPRG